MYIYIYLHICLFNITVTFCNCYKYPTRSRVSTNWDIKGSNEMNCLCPWETIFNYARIRNTLSEKKVTSYLISLFSYLNLLTTQRSPTLWSSQFLPCGQHGKPLDLQDVHPYVLCFWGCRAKDEGKLFSGAWRVFLKREHAQVMGHRCQVTKESLCSFNHFLLCTCLIRGEFMEGMT